MEDTAIQFPYPKIIDRAIGSNHRPICSNGGDGSAVSLGQNHRSIAQFDVIIARFVGKLHCRLLIWGNG
ncbi:hypothetical protein [Microcoleus sp. BROC3]|uniref:hypothetical protein n=1 Tax=Microcoleus sp. BROC3 TaxID=3055323 RepID=UPI002FD660F1